MTLTVERGAEPDPRVVDRPVLPTRPQAALAGLLGAGAALTAGEVASSLVGSIPSPILSVARVVIDLSPLGLREAAISSLGTGDKPALIAGVLVVSALLGAGLGLVGRRRPVAATAGLAVFGMVGLVAAQSDPRATLLGGAAAALIGVTVGVLTLRALLGRTQPRSGAMAQAAASSQRRDFLRASGVAAGGIALGAGVVKARGLASSKTPVASGPVPSSLAAVPTPLPVVAVTASLEIPGISPLVTPTGDFYRIDTALVVPKVDASRWRLQVEGMVRTPFELTLAELSAMPQVELDCTIACVSNEVGGDLVGTARWQGVPLAAVLERAGIDPRATQLMGESVDGFTAGFPIEAATDGRGALLALGMNGVPLPAKHGYPARLIVPGLYGYVSATKWLKTIRVNRLGDEDGYWIPRGWSKLGPVKTQCRIDVPGSRRLPVGRTPVAGVAWAPTRDVAKVEVQVDDGPWQEATLGQGLGRNVWRQWVWTWDAQPGQHVLRARATDGTGAVQTAERAPVNPDGATGYPSLRVQVG
jgi:DMSO/TMAO reductase YedYZ molybdopterin-dependent catalytic subunit